MNLKHRVQINVAQSGANSQAIIKSGIRKVPRRLMNFLFGGIVEVLVLTPGKSVQSVEIHEVDKGGLVT